MTRLQKLLALVARRRANGAPEEVINRTLEDNGYSRKRFEEAVRKSIAREANAKPDQFGAFVEGLKKNSVGVARDLVAVPLMEWGDELEAGARALLGEDYDQTVRFAIGLKGTNVEILAQYRAEHLNRIHR